MQILSGKFPCDVISENGIQEAGMEIRPFHTSHDSAESVGYRISLPNGRVVVIATDLGFVSEEVRSALAGCDVAVMESNHDVGMLQSGGYPYYLKRRILSPQGHLSNSACAQELPDLVRQGTTRILLAHLSRENNIPQLAYQTALCSLLEQGMKAGEDFLLQVSPVENSGGHTLLI